MFRKIREQVFDFMKFVREQRVVGLAVSFILAGAVSKLVSSMVVDLINPVVGIALGFAGDLKSQSVRVGSARIMWGSFVSNLIDFLIIALVVYALVRILGIKLTSKKKK